MERIDIEKLLKDCPSGMELDCTMFDNLYFDDIADDGNRCANYRIRCYTICDNTKLSVVFSKFGTYTLDKSAKCVIFPKGKTTWEGFIPPHNFKDGDIVATENGDIIGITIGGEINKFIPTYCIIIKPDNKFEAYIDTKETWLFNRLATEEEKKKLFDAIRENGYKWNSESKILETLPVPKFKVGDIVYIRDRIEDYRIINITDSHYILQSRLRRAIEYKYEIFEDKYWELYHRDGKFDISTLVIFESKVLVRDHNDQRWKPGIFGGYINNPSYSYYITVGGGSYKQLIPYNGNEHLCNKSIDCSKYYKTWE